MRTIRVLHIIYGMDRGGAETMIMNYYRHIDRNIVQFDFLISEPNKCDYEDEIKSLGGKIYRIRILSKNPIGYLMDVDNFFKLHREYKIVHSHSSAKNAIPLLIARKNKIPVRICHSHNTRNEKGVIGFIKNLLRPFVKCVATDYFACGQKSGEWLYGMTFYKKKGIIMRNAIDANKYHYNIDTRKKYRNDIDNYIIIGNVARFDFQKNHIFLIKIFKEIYNINHNVLLFLIGDGPLRKEIEEQVKLYGLENNVKFLGVINNVSDYMQAMDAFLLPSIYEGLPLTLVEAQAAGLRCFTSKGVVSSEADITGLVTFISLDDGPKEWARIIMNKIDYKREDTYRKISSAGYDITNQAKWLQNYYVAKYEKAK